MNDEIRLGLVTTTPDEVIIFFGDATNPELETYHTRQSAEKEGN